MTILKFYVSQRYCQIIRLKTSSCTNIISYMKSWSHWYVRSYKGYTLKQQILFTPKTINYYTVSITRPTELRNCIQTKGKIGFVVIPPNGLIH